MRLVMMEDCRDEPKVQVENEDIDYICKIMKLVTRGCFVFSRAMFLPPQHPPLVPQPLVGVTA